MRVQTLVILLLTLPFSLLAQEDEAQTVKVKAEYLYVVPSNVSLDEAKAIAIQRAQITAIADEFGTTVAQNNFTNISNSGSKSEIDFKSVGISEVKGEWIESIGQPKVDVIFKEGIMTIKVKVVGRAREIKYSSGMFMSNILRNGLSEKHKSNNFYSGDDLYLQFITAQDGYLAVYLLDKNQDAYCLLPYRDCPTGTFEVTHGREYILFSREMDKSTDYVDEYIMSTDGANETNEIYIIYSPNKFVKSIDTQTDDQLPRMLSFADFQLWLSANRRRDREMQVRKQQITIQAEK